jgi:hypothetical protein
MEHRAGRLRSQVAFFLVASSTACSPPAPLAQGPDTAQSAAATAGSTAAPTGAASASAAAQSPVAPATATAPEPTTIVIHQADLFGEIQSRAGTTVHVLSLVTTSKDPPAAGTKGVLFRKLDGATTTDWLNIADVVVKKAPDAAGKMQLTITDEKKDVLVEGKKSNHFAKNVRVKLRWEW